MEVRQRAVEDQQLSDYYSAALRFIDDKLSLESELEQVETAALRRQQALTSLPEPVAASDREQLAEALSFVRRAYCRLHPQRCAEDEVARSLDAFPAIEPALNGNGHPAAELAGELDLSEFTPPARELPEAALTMTALPVELDPRTLESVAEPATVASVSGPSSAPPGWATAEPIAASRRRSPLSRIWDEQQEHAADELLPEQRALPLAAGLLLLAGEAWLALFAGWVATRFLVWPIEGFGYEVSTFGALGLVLFGTATAGVAAYLIWRYRSATRRLALLVHATGALIALDLLAWRIAATDTLPVIDAPGVTAVALLALGWAAAAAAAHIRDLRMV